MSSSSATCNPDFNPEYLRKPIELTVVHSDGTSEAVVTAGVYLLPGANFSFDADAESDLVILSAGPGIGEEDPYYRQKFNALAALTSDNDNGSPLAGPSVDPTTGVVPEGDPWTFTRESMWLAAINGIPPDSLAGAFFLAVDPCSILGTFDTVEINGYPQASEASLTYIDQCVPCNGGNCLVLQQLYTFVSRLETFYDYLFALWYNTDTTNIPAHPDGGVRDNYAGLVMQHQATRSLWDYKVHRSSFRMSVLGQGQSIVVAAYYRNVSNADVGNPSGLTLTLTFAFFRNGVAWQQITEDLIKGRVLTDRPGADSPPAEIITKTLANETFTPWPTSAHTYEAELNTFDAGLPGSRFLSAGGVLRADFVLMVTDTQAFDDGATYTVQVTGMLTPTHLIESGNPTGDIALSDIVTFVPGDPQGSST